MRQAPPFLPFDTLPVHHPPRWFLGPGGMPRTAAAIVAFGIGISDSALPIAEGKASQTVKLAPAISL